MGWLGLRVGREGHRGSHQDASHQADETATDSAGHKVAVADRQERDWHQPQCRPQAPGAPWDTPAARAVSETPSTAPAPVPQSLGALSLRSCHSPRPRPSHYPSAPGFGTLLSQHALGALHFHSPYRAPSIPACHMGCSPTIPQCPPAPLLIQTALGSSPLPSQPLLSHNAVGPALPSCSRVPRSPSLPQGSDPSTIPQCPRAGSLSSHHALQAREPNPLHYPTVPKGWHPILPIMLWGPHSPKIPWGSHSRSLWEGPDPLHYPTVPQALTSRRRPAPRRSGPRRPAPAPAAGRLGAGPGGRAGRRGRAPARGPAPPGPPAPPRPPALCP